MQETHIFSITAALLFAQMEHTNTYLIKLALIAQMDAYYVTAQASAQNVQMILTTIHTIKTQ